jgi:hypothetical protein
MPEMQLRENLGEETKKKHTKTKNPNTLKISLNQPNFSIG